MKENKKRMSVQIQCLLMMMVAIIVASMTVTACLEDENSEENGGNGGGGVSGKRLKSWVTTCSKPLPESRMDYSYNTDGTLKRTDTYDASSKLLIYSILTNNSDGKPEKVVTYNANGTVLIETTNTYNPDKTVQKAKMNNFNNGVLAYTVDVDYTYQNGKKILEVYNMNGIEFGRYSSNYDNNGRRTSTIYTYNANTMTYTHSYNSDGTLQKITYPYSFEDNTLVTQTYTWENGKTTFSHDDFLAW